MRREFWIERWAEKQASASVDNFGLHKTKPVCCPSYVIETIKVVEISDIERVIDVETIDELISSMETYSRSRDCDFDQEIEKLKSLISASI